MIMKIDHLSSKQNNKNNIISKVVNDGNLKLLYKINLALLII